MRRVLKATVALVCAGAPACVGAGLGGDGEASLSGLGTGADSGSAVTSHSTGGGQGTGHAVLDVAPVEDLPPSDHCSVAEGLDALSECDERAPPRSFDPDLQWSWTGPRHGRYSAVTPLVANLTDDNADGSIDLCDTPDVIVVAADSGSLTDSGDKSGYIFVLDGASGALHFQFAAEVAVGTTPALGDIDGDGLVEIVTTTPVGPKQLIAFEHDGSIKWMGASLDPAVVHFAIAMADLDHDGRVEILAERLVADSEGQLRFSAPTPRINSSSATVAAHIFGDDRLEVILGPSAVDHAGNLLWHNDDVVGGRFAQVADLDADGLPEVLVTADNGLALLEHNGATKYAALRPTGVSDATNNWSRPAAVDDLDGDGRPEYAMSSQIFYSTYEADGSVAWSAPVTDETGVAGGTAFDFLGDGSAEAMYADERSLFVFDSRGGVRMQVARTSRTWSEYPVVADVDNDGSAEVVVVSNISLHGDRPSPTVQVFRDREDRWVRARRIWNQHTYHVTNIREDGTIPEFEPNNWEHLNTFRTQAQVLPGGGVCRPTP